MAFDNLVVKQVIVHEVYRRRDDGAPVSPTYGGQLIQLQPAAMDVFKERVVDALGSSSQCMQMDIARADGGSAIEIASGLLGAVDGQFATISQKFADKLTGAQLSRILPGGILAVFSGTASAASHPFVAVIKAETQGGFRREANGGHLSMRYLQDLFLTPAAKLYKIGVFVREHASQKVLPDGWTALIYDNHMSNANRDGAAKYFYDSFLGCRLPENSARLTKAFFEHTREFIRDLDASPEAKTDLVTSLYTYLKVDQATTIDVDGFSRSYIPNDKRDDYLNFMQARRFPQNAVQKDLTELKGKLRLRKLGFGGNIRLTAPPEAFKDMISIETIPQDGSASGLSKSWTRITIRDQIRDQE